jgi:coatomer protein complex subunit alpha (xenin)
LRNKYNERNRDSKDIEVEIKCVLEGHDRAVNWVDFHISNNMVVSGGDDKKIKLWKYNDNKGWEYDTIYGHSNNVCCVGFRENLSIIISAGEDKALKIWDFNKRMLLMEMKKEDRFWVFANHRKENIIAAGHDNGFMIISLTHDRIPYVRIDDNYMIFIQGNQMFLHSLNTH